MFGKKKDNGTVGAAPGTINIIGPDTTISGEVTAKSNIRIDGTLQGNIRTQARLILGAKGTIEGDIWCKEAELSGHVKGNVYVQGLLVLTATARITGNIATMRLKIMEGAQYNGACEMGEKSVNAHFEEKKHEKVTPARSKVVA